MSRMTKADLEAELRAAEETIARREATIQELASQLNNAKDWAADKARLADRLLSIMEWHAKEGHLG